MMKPGTMYELGMPWYETARRVLGMIACAIEIVSCIRLLMVLRRVKERKEGWSMSTKL